VQLGFCRRRRLGTSQVFFIALILGRSTAYPPLPEEGGLKAIDKG